jgi:hypothetical protein
MRVLPRTQRGTWALAGAVWLAWCAAVWLALPVRPRAAWDLPEEDWLFALSGDGRTVLTAPRYFAAGAGFCQLIGPLSVWDVRTGQSRTFLGEGDNLHEYAISPDGRWLAYCDAARAARPLRVLDLSTGHAVAELSASPRGYSLDQSLPVISPDSVLLFYADRLDGVDGLQLVEPPRTAAGRPHRQRRRAGGVFRRRPHDGLPCSGLNPAGRQGR